VPRRCHARSTAPPTAGKWKPKARWGWGGACRGWRSLPTAAEPRAPARLPACRARPAGCRGKTRAPAPVFRMRWEWAPRTPPLTFPTRNSPVHRGAGGRPAPPPNKSRRYPARSAHSRYGFLRDLHLHLPLPLRAADAFPFQLPARPATPRPAVSALCRRPWGREGSGQRWRHAPLRHARRPPCLT
jgi:hypothetical protein